jgi:hypothetical protein
MSDIFFITDDLLFLYIIFRKKGCRRIRISVN